ncbi:uncharacterized protein LOC129046918 [Molothrus ater]|uniref:uncharacterized protein LOC129046918 n=1 Tax=Molothrus ater TaxID=84834 RepID=UPI0023E862CD|nr:uncharacterized protein LOC129046918 [Molothrus ater]
MVTRQKFIGPERGQFLAVSHSLTASCRLTGPRGYRFPQILPIGVDERQPEEAWKRVLQRLDSAASRTPHPARRHDDCPRRRSDGTHACAVATTPAPAISLHADSSNHSAASGISCTHAQFYLHGPAATLHCVRRSFGTARSRFRVAACCCPATAGIPVPCHPTSAATASVHSTTAGENCSALHVSFRVSPSAGHREIPLQRVTLSNRYLVCLRVFAFHTPSTQWTTLCHYSSAQPHPCTQTVPQGGGGGGWNMTAALINTGQTENYFAPANASSLIPTQKNFEKELFPNSSRVPSVFGTDFSTHK